MILGNLSKMSMPQLFYHVKDEKRRGGELLPHRGSIKIREWMHLLRTVLVYCIYSDGLPIFSVIVMRVERDCVFF